MPAKPPKIAAVAAERLVALGREIQARRKGLKISATVAAEAAGMSRVTWHRIERGEPAVTMGAYLNAITTLGLDLCVSAPLQPVIEPHVKDRNGWIPVRIRLSDYPQLKQLAWQVHGTDTLTPVEALNVYERNARHFDEQALEVKERQLLEMLRLALGRSFANV